jgi:arylsulfatase A-like enzyme
MKRILFLFTLLFGTAVFAADTPNTNVPNTDTPNVIVIFIDDMGYADIGPFGSKVPTPNLDAMAAEGRRFTNFIVPSAVCSASRSALMTGCYNRRVNISGALPPNSKIGLNPAEETIAEVVKKKGYTTAIFGKWHLGDKPEFLPPAQGFDEYFGLPYSNDMWNRHPDIAKFPEPTVKNKRKYPALQFIEGSTPIGENLTPEDQKTLTTRYTDRAVKFIEKNKDKQFFLYVPHSMVHVPLAVSDKFAGKSGAGLFGDVIMEVDWSVGQILDAVRKNGLDKKTLVVFTADNGPWLNFGNHAGSAKPLREGKGTSFEGGVREPTVFWYPGKIPANTVCNELASSIDILPTVAALTGSPLPEKKIDGKDIRPLLFGEKDAVSPHTAYPIYFQRQLQAIRDNRWKLVLPHQYRTLDGQEPGKDGSPGQYVQRKTELALYDLQNDVSETTDVSSQHSEIVQRLQKAAEEVRAELGEGDKLGPGVRPAGKIAD